MYDFGGQTAVVTGGTGVLGGAIAIALAEAGANVIILGRNPEAGDKIRERMPANAESEFLVCDVLAREALLAAAEKIHDRVGPVDILVNAAGGNNPNATTTAGQTFFDLPPEMMQCVLGLNCTGTILPCQVFGRQMAQKGRGSILNVVSMAALRPLTRVVAYSAAKAGVSNFTQWLAVHLAQEYSPNIRVNAVAPGFFLTSQNRFLLKDAETGELTARGKSIIDHTPMARFGAPNDLLGGALWLLSSGASSVTGVVVPIDGGFSAFSGV